MLVFPGTVDVDVSDYVTYNSNFLDVICYILALTATYQYCQLQLLLYFTVTFTVNVNVTLTVIVSCNVSC